MKTQTEHETQYASITLKTLASVYLRITQKDANLVLLGHIHILITHL